MAVVGNKAEVVLGGSGTYYRVWINGVMVWTWPTHIDGPLSDDAKSLFGALEAAWR